MSREKQPALKPGSVYGCNTVIGPGEPEYHAGHYYVRVECWSCKERRDVTVDNLLSGKSKRCRRCALGARRVMHGLAKHTQGAGGQFYLDEFDAL